MKTTAGSIFLPWVSQVAAVAATVILATSAVFPVRAEEPEAAWKTIDIGGIPHVSVESLKTTYGFDKLNRDGPAIILENAKVRVSMETGSTVSAMNGIRFHFTRPVVEHEGEPMVSLDDVKGILQPVLVPTGSAESGNIQTVILDPIGGGKEKGVVNEYGSEAGMAFRVAKLAKARLEADGFHVVMTREDEGGMSLEKRRDFANGIKEDAIFIRISFGSGPQDIAGFSTWVLSCPPPADAPPDARDFSSPAMALATAIHGSTVRKFGKNIADGAISRDTTSLFSSVIHPAVWVKAGTMSSPDEAKLIASEQFQTILATSISDSVSKYWIAVSGIAVRKEALQEPAAGEPTITLPPGVGPESPPPEAESPSGP